MVVIHTAGIHMESIHMGDIHMGAMITITATVTGVQVKDRGWGMAAGCCNYRVLVTVSLPKSRLIVILLQQSYGVHIPVRMCDRLQSASVAPGTKLLASCLYTVTYVIELLMHAMVRAGARAVTKNIHSTHVVLLMISVYSTCDKMQTIIAQSYTRPVFNLIYTHMILVHDLPGQHMHHPMCNFHARASHTQKAG
jgi:hypothetical protein